VFGGDVGWDGDAEDFETTYNLRLMAPSSADYRTNLTLAMTFLICDHHAPMRTWTRRCVPPPFQFGGCKWIPGSL